MILYFYYDKLFPQRSISCPVICCNSSADRDTDIDLSVIRYINNHQYYMGSDQSQ